MSVGSQQRQLISLQLLYILPFYFSCLFTFSTYNSLIRRICTMKFQRSRVRHIFSHKRNEWFSILLSIWGLLFCRNPLSDNVGLLSFRTNFKFNKVSRFNKVQTLSGRSHVSIISMWIRSGFFSYSTSLSFLSNSTMETNLSDVARVGTYETLKQVGTPYCLCVCSSFILYSKIMRSHFPKQNINTIS